MSAGGYHRSEKLSANNCWKAFGNASVQSSNHDTQRPDRLADCWLSPCCLLYSCEHSACVSLLARQQVEVCWFVSELAGRSAHSKHCSQMVSQ